MTAINATANATAGQRASDGPASTSPARIGLRWLVWLRWLAAIGQVFAITAAVFAFRLNYQLGPLAAVIVTTILTNAGVELLLRLEWPAPRWVTAALLILDVALLTVLLHYTGGPENPFAVLYAVHVAMATVVLGAKWGWVTVGVVLACFTLLSLVEPAEAAETLTPSTRRAGQFAALSLELALIAYFIGRVLSSLRQREAELATARERAAQGEQLAALTTLAAGAAHELGTPLGTIAVVSKEMEFLAAKHDIGDLVDDAKLVREQVERCRGILDHLRGDVAGRTTDEADHCRLGELFDAVSDQVPPTRRTRLIRPGQNTVELSREALVSAPQRAMEQAVGFLIDNAFDASADDGRVWLDVQFEKIDRSVDEFDRRACTVRFTVVDKGSGMTEEQVRRAVEPFYTTKDPGKGMGLGLFLVRLIADRHGGSFELKSDEGAGTSATLRLPCELPAARFEGDKLSRDATASAGE